MPIEIRPVSGQPGLFKQGLAAHHPSHLHHMRPWRNPRLVRNIQYASVIPSYVDPGPDLISIEECRRLNRSLNGLGMTQPEICRAEALSAQYVQRHGLGSIRWTSTAGSGFIPAPFGNRGRRSLADFNALEAYALPADFKMSNVLYSQEDIPSGQVPGVRFKLLIFTPGPIVPQNKLDDMFRTLFGGMGYDVSSSSLAAQNVKYVWAKDPAPPGPDGAVQWNAVQVEGPPETQGSVLFGQYGAAAQPTGKDNSFAVAETYALTLRPQDSQLSVDKLRAIDVNTRPLRKTIMDLAGSAPGSTDTILTRAVATVRGVPPAALVEGPPPKKGLGVVLSLLGIGWTTFLAMKGHA